MEKTNQKTDQLPLDNQKTFNAFGKEFTREQAEWLIFSDKRSEICYARCTDTLEFIIQDGWKGTSEWSDQELQDTLDELLENNIVYHGPNKDGIEIPLEISG